MRWPFTMRRKGLSQAEQGVIQALNLRVSQLEEALLALQAAHERLRGRFYALKGPEEPKRPLTKAEILANWQKSQR